MTAAAEDRLGIPFVATQFLHHLVSGQVVGGDEGHSTRTQDASPIQLSAVQKHLRESEEVCGCADKTVAPAQKLRPLQVDTLSLGRVLVLVELQGSVRAGFITSRESVHFLRRNEEASIHHAQWFQHALAHDLIKGPPRKNLDEAADHVSRDAVVKPCAWFEGERRLPQFLHPASKVVGAVHEVVDPMSLVVPVHNGIPEISVGESSSVRAELPDGDGFGSRTPLLSVRVDQDL
mmetsp:Transcript_14494/g.31806  ORF Transcript_14494/g.31806 Transcript_14494/m.31806 type:complete len:234 (+) Transcript_14494:523-1224(+)